MSFYVLEIKAIGLIYIVMVCVQIYVIK
ncbi:uncharacterized protein METZ01_LOCUS271280 [marine metagenome]|uniref:Uncharacterized protein n=1 Tax=marine metagenome TaxID=408172 RepID=A0A382K344_9ZZZZ